MTDENATHDQQVLAFLTEFTLDRDQGHHHPLRHYLQRYAGLEEQIAAEFLALQRVAGEGTTTGRVGPYELLNEIGHGGQGTVWLARDTRLGRQVAVKILQDDLRAAISPERFEREARLAARFDHPGLCQVYDVGEDHGRRWLAMRHVPGQPLAERIAVARTETRPGRRALLSWPGADTGTPRQQVLAITAALARTARALHEAHRQGVLHRDVKPGNVLVTPHGEPVLVDFGLARDVAPDAASMTLTGDLLGTPAYLAPELLGPTPRPATVQTDLWSLAIVLFEALTLQQPFTGATHHAVLQAILDRPPPPLRSLVPAAPRDLQRVLDVALDKNPAHRYRDAAAFAEDLERVAAGNPPLARPPSRLRRLGRLARRHPTTTAVLACIFAGLLGALWLVDSQRQQQTDLRELAQQRARDLHRLARSLLFDLHGQVRDLPGATEANRRIAEAAAEFLAVLRAEPDAAGTVRDDLVHAQLQIGDALGNPRHPNVGRPDDARACYAEAWRLLGGDAGPRAEPATARLRAATLLRQGELHDDVGERNLALGLWSRAFGELTDLPPAVPTEILRATLEVRRGEALVAANPDDRTADELFAAATQRFARLRGAVPDPAEIAIEEAGAHAAAAAMHQQRAAWAAAAAAANTAQELLLELPADHALRLRVRNLQAAIDTIAGLAAWHRGDSAAGAERLRAAVATLDELTRLDPRDERCFRRRLLTRLELAELLLEAGDLPAARAQNEQVLYACAGGVGTPLIELSAWRSRALAVAGRIALASFDAVAARHAFQEALALLPARSSGRDETPAALLAAFAEACARSGDPEGAAQLLRTAMAAVDAHILAAQLAIARAASAMPTTAGALPTPDRLRDYSSLAAEDAVAARSLCEQIGRAHV